MLEPSGRKLFRSPLPFSQPTRPSDSTPNRAQAQNSPGDDRAIADAETQEMPSLPLNSSRDRAIADVETHKIFSFPLIPSYSHSPVSVRKKTRRAQTSKRKKILLLVLTVALLVPTFTTLFEIVNTVVLYKLMQNGIAHLQAVETMFHGSSNSVSRMAQYFDIHKLRKAQKKLTLPTLISYH